MAEGTSLEVLRTLEKISKDLLGKMQSLPLVLPSKRDIFQSLATRTELAQEAALNPPPVTVALLGVTGAGKSSLVNALIGADLMPWSSAETCTAGIARVRQSDMPGYRVSVQFVDLDSWNEDIDRLRRQIDALSTEAEPEESGDGQGELLGVGLHAVSPEDRSRISAVYGDEAIQSLASAMDLANLSLPAAIKYAMQKGSEVAEVETIEAAKEIVEQYLSTASRNGFEPDDGQFWPIVQSVLVEGRFPGMVAGAELVDLPGVNDPNRAREQKTLDFLASANFVFVANTARSLLDAGTRQVLQSRNVMNRLLAMNVPHVLTLIGTKCDAQIKRNDNAFAQMASKETASKAELALFRNDNWRNKFRNDLGELAEQLIPHEASTEQHDLWSEIVCDTPIFLTSAQDFQNLEALANGDEVDDKPVFESLEQTGILALREHFKEICLDLGPYSTVRKVVSELEEIINIAIASLNGELLNTRMSNAQLSASFEALRLSVQVLAADLEIRILDIRHTHQERLHLKGGKVKTSIEFNPVSVNRAVNEFRLKLNSLHWMTLRATVTNGGNFYSPSRNQVIDIYEWVSSNLITNRMATWTEMFTLTVPDEINSTSLRLLHEAQLFADSLSEQTRLVADMPDVAPLVQEQVQRSLASNIASLDIVKNAIAERASLKSTEFISVIQKIVFAKMRPTVREAARESGIGMSRRMREQLAAAASIAIPESYEAVSKDLSDLVDEAIADSILEMNRTIDELSLNISAITALISGHAPAMQEIDEEKIQASVASLEVHLDELHQRAVIKQESAAEDVTEKNNDESHFYVYMDGSNISVDRFGGSPVANLDKLLACRTAIQNEFPHATVETFVDGRYRHLLAESDRARFTGLVDEGVLSDKASGVKGGADKVILEAASRSGAIVISNDHFRDWSSQYPFLRDEGRHLSAREVPGAGWLFLPMSPNLTVRAVS
jgi:hypothetical protein